MQKSIQNFWNEHQVWMILGLCALVPNVSAESVESTKGLSIGMHTSSFISKSFKTQSRYELGFEGETAEAQRILSASVSALSSFGLRCTSCSFVEFRELLLRSAPPILGNNSLRLSVGRRHLGWSQVDEKWNLGLTDPRFRNDELNPLKSGVSGAFVEQSIGSLELGLFVSTFYIPERGTNIEDNGGVVSSDSPWFVEPPKEVVFLDQATPIRYYPNIPEVSKILRQNSVGFFVSTPLWTGSQTSLFYMNKPSNQLALSYNAILDLSSLVSRVDLYPRVVQHNLWGFDFIQKIGKSKLHFGMMGEKLSELDQGFAEGSTKQIFQPAQVYAIDVSRSSEMLKRVGLTVSASMIKVDKKVDQDVGALAQPSGQSIFSDRFLFKDALQISGSFDFATAQLKRNTVITASYTRDIKYNSEILSLQGAWLANQQLTINLAFDFLAANNEKDGFVGQFRSNDRVSGGVRYVF